MRPTGTKNGRLPAGGYPRTDPDTRSFLAGFLEGEACFGINRQTGYDSHGCFMYLSVRDDDAELLESLQDATRIGRIGAVSARRSSKAQIRWKVTAKADCERLCQLLEQHPLRGRKSYDYAVWRAAVRWWIGPGAAFREHQRDWTAMAYLKSRIETGRRFDPDRAAYPIHDDADRASADWRSYVAGLLTADGSYSIAKHGSGLRPQVSITQRVDDLPLLEEIRRRVGAGGVYEARAYGNAAPSARWIVADRSGLLKVLSFLEDHPPRGRRGVEHRVFKSAVRVHCSSAGREDKTTDLLDLRRELAELRLYRPR